MTKQLGVLIIHGMGDPDPNFADGLIRRLSQRLDEQAERVVFSACYWAPILQQHQDTIWRKVNEDNRLDWQLARKWVVSSLGDPVSYLAGFFKNNQPVYGDIHNLVRSRLEQLEAELDPGSRQPLMVLAHSLGSIIISNYIWDEQADQGIGQTSFERAETLTSLITYGSTIPLFVPPRTEIRCIRFPDAALPSPYRPVARWINLFDRDDVLGYPLQNIWTETQGTRIEDRQINVGSLFNSWTPYSHVQYHNDDDFQEVVVAQIQDILAVTDAEL